MYNMRCLYILKLYGLVQEIEMSPKTLILIPCHGVWFGNRGDGINPNAGDSRAEWALAPFQIEGYDHLCFKDHILEALKRLKNDPQAIAIVSGGQTKKECGPISEAQSYYSLATQLCNDKNIVERVHLEEYARDSFENVLFLLCKFYELFGAYPDHLRVVGFEFKRKRFLDLHLKQALKFVNCEYIGNDPDPRDIIDKDKYFQDLHQAEYNHAVKHFENDWYGVQSPLLQKRVSRNPFGRRHGYHESNPSLAPLLEAIGDERKTYESSEKIRNKVTFPWKVAE